MTWFRRRKRKATDQSDRRAAEHSRNSAKDKGNPVPLADPAEAALRFWTRWDELLPSISVALGERELGRAGR
jgi:hypothetical protein